MITYNSRIWSANPFYDSSTKRRGKCSKRSLTYPEANEIAKKYIERVVMQFGKFNAYYCAQHQSWHVGHNGKRKAILKTLNSMIMCD